MLWQAGGDLLTSDNTKPAFDSDAGKAALQQLQDMAVTDKSVYLDQGNGKYLNLFNSGKIAMLWTGPWDLSSINADVHVRRDLPAGLQRQPRDDLRPRPLHAVRPLGGPVEVGVRLHHLADLGPAAPQVRDRDRRPAAASVGDPAARATRRS